MRYIDVKVVYIERNIIHIEWCQVGLRHAGTAYNCHSIIKLKQR
jgi:hypothetical protein